MEITSADTQYNPGDQARFTGHNLNPPSLYVATDQTGEPLINFAIQGASVQRFQSYTSENIGHYLTIALDDKVVESAVIQSTITGQAAIEGNFTQQQAHAIVAALKYGTLPVALTQQT